MSIIPSFLIYELKTDFFNLQEQETVNKRSKIHEPRKTEQEEADEKDLMEKIGYAGLMETMKCFLRNFATSACPNAAKGIFVNLEGAKGFLKGH